MKEEKLTQKNQGITKSLLYKYIYYILIFMFITYSTNIIVNISNTDMKLNHKIVIYEAKMKRMAGGTTIYI